MPARTECPQIEMTLQQDVGSQAERTALAYLQRKEYNILATNYHTRRGEIDIIAMEGNSLVFIEVKGTAMRNNPSLRYRINPIKQKRIYLTALDFLAKNDLSVDAMRFDAILMTQTPGDEWIIDHIRDAFRVDESLL